MWCIKTPQGIIITSPSCLESQILDLLVNIGNVRLSLPNWDTQVRRNFCDSRTNQNRSRKLCN